ncbi:hypothetical protein XdyCFBP7245_08075 [Xanthomonas dyei]|uniref:Uncharacterized protein n=1 Tax=Xanthomonas dyei TaxID=743699 RepID=A0A2S7C611_9XANT|nr:hypothetical protein XdyCFBP7245_08075 [Xanthomonas dyei]
MRLHQRSGTSGASILDTIALRARQKLVPQAQGRGVPVLWEHRGACGSQSENGVEAGCLWAYALTDNTLAAASMDGDETSD